MPRNEPAITISPQPVLAAVDTLFPDPELGHMPALRMRGDTMLPTLRNGDYAVIDTAHTEAGRADVYAVLNGRSVIITQVQLIREDGRSTGRILCTPRNFIVPGLGAAAP
jgi:Peptidase S24-like